MIVIQNKALPFPLLFLQKCDGMQTLFKLKDIL